MTLSPVAVETGNSVADEEANRLGGATVDVQVALAGNLSDRL
jgi:hypothetical protein